jgi:Ca-activated chloride channel family protein
MIRITKIVVALLIVIIVLLALVVITTHGSTRDNIPFGQEQNGKTSTPATNGAQDDERITVGTNLVSVNVTVTGSDGKYVRGLGREQFEVFDDNVRRQIAFFSAEDAPATFGIVYDMHPTTAERATATFAALKQFARTLRPEDNFFIVAFNERGSLALDFIPTLEQVQTHLPVGKPKGAASLYDAVYMAAGKIRESKNTKRALLVISDGEDHSSRRGYKELRNRIREFDVQIYSVGINDPPNISSANSERWSYEDLTRRTGRRTLSQNAEAAMGAAALVELAKASGGTAYFPEANSERELAGICTLIAIELRQQYAIGFYPTGTTSGAKWHRLRIRVLPSGGSQGRLALSYREGYQSLPAQR